MADWYQMYTEAYQDAIRRGLPPPNITDFVPGTIQPNATGPNTPAGQYAAANTPAPGTTPTPPAPSTPSPSLFANNMSMTGAENVGGVGMYTGANAPLNTQLFTPNPGQTNSGPPQGSIPTGDPNTFITPWGSTWTTPGAVNNATESDYDAYMTRAFGGNRFDPNNPYTRLMKQLAQNPGSIDANTFQRTMLNPQQNQPPQVSGVGPGYQQQMGNSQLTPMEQAMWDNIPASWYQQYGTLGGLPGQASYMNPAMGAQIQPTFGQFHVMGEQYIQNPYLMQGPRKTQDYDPRKINNEMTATITDGNSPYPSFEFYKQAMLNKQPFSTYGQPYGQQMSQYGQFPFLQNSGATLQPTSYNDWGMPKTWGQPNGNQQMTYNPGTMSWFGGGQQQEPNRGTQWDVAGGDYFPRGWNDLTDYAKQSYMGGGSVPTSDQVKAATFGTPTTLTNAAQNPPTTENINYTAPATGWGNVKNRQQSWGGGNMYGGYQPQQSQNFGFSTSRSGRPASYGGYY